MALEADQGLRLRRQLLKLQQGFELAFVFFSLTYPFDRQTAGTMAGFAVHQGEAGVRSDLLAMDRPLKVDPDLFVFVTFSQAIFVTDIVGVKATDNQLLIFTNRIDLVVIAKMLQVGTGNEGKQDEDQCQFEFQSGNSMQKWYRWKTEIKPLYMQES